jgi:hypothetical protein
VVRLVGLVLEDRRRTWKKAERWSKETNALVNELGSFLECGCLEPRVRQMSSRY